jgi:hypothetical protein
LREQLAVLALSLPPPTPTRQRRTRNLLKRRDEA